MPPVVPSVVPSGIPAVIVIPPAGATIGIVRIAEAQPADGNPKARLGRLRSGSQHDRSQYSTECEGFDGSGLHNAPSFGWGLRVHEVLCRLRAMGYSRKKKTRVLNLLHNSILTSEYCCKVGRIRLLAGF